jgi:hypothetical protein
MDGLSLAVRESAVAGDDIRIIPEVSGIEGQKAKA